MGVRKYNDARKEANERYRKKFYRPTVNIDKDLQQRIKGYCEAHEISVNEFFNRAANLLLNQE